MTTTSKPTVEDILRQLRSARGRIGRLEETVEFLIETMRTSGIHVDAGKLAKISAQSNLGDVHVPIRTLLGQLGNERGAWAERETLAAVYRIGALASFKPKILSARMAMRSEDAAGIDVVVETDLGRIDIQVKSSKTGAREARAKRPAEQVFPVILVVTPEMNQRSIDRNVSGILTFGAGELRRRQKIVT